MTAFGPIPPQEPPANENRLLAILDPSKHFVELSQSFLIPPNTTHSFPFPIQLADIQVFDTLTQLFQFYAASTPDLEDFRFLLGWNTLSHSEKLAKYTEYTSNELNFFIKQRDAAFFNTVVRAYLEVKQEKRFFDYYLLDAKEEMQTRLKSGKYPHQLDAFEQLLLGETLNLEEIIKNFKAECKHPKGAFSKKNRNKRPSTNRIEIKRTRQNMRASTYIMPKDTPDTSEQQFQNALWKDGYKEDAASFYFGAYVRGERCYYQLPVSECKPGTYLVYPDQFWWDYATYIHSSMGKDKPSAHGFISENLDKIHPDLTGIVFALSVIDLPFTHKAHSVDVNQHGVVSNVLTGRFPVLIKYKELRSVELPPSIVESMLFVVQSIHPHSDPNITLTNHDLFSSQTV